MRDLNCHNIADLREAARRRLPRGLFEYVDRGTEEEVSLRNNRAAFDRIQFMTRPLVDVTGRATKTRLFGEDWAMPLAITRRSDPTMSIVSPASKSPVTSTTPAGNSDTVPFKSALAAPSSTRTEPRTSLAKATHNCRADNARSEP
mgnify:CR=1 FL=1